MREEDEERKAENRLIMRDPSMTDKEVGGEATLKRLFEVTYICPLCGMQHVSETYVTTVTGNLEALLEKGMALLNNPENAMLLLSNHAASLHEDLGNLDNYLELARRELTPAKIIVNDITMTDEDSFRCDLCSRRFETMGEMWTHAGRDPSSAKRIGKAACDPE